MNHSVYVIFKVFNNLQKYFARILCQKVGFYRKEVLPIRYLVRIAKKIDRKVLPGMKTCVYRRQVYGIYLNASILLYIFLESRVEMNRFLSLL